MRETASALLARATLPTTVVWCAFLSTTVIYGVVLWFVADPSEPPVAERGPLAADPLFLPLVLASLAALVFARLVPRRLLLSAARLRAADAREFDPASSGSAGLKPADIEAIAALPAAERRPFRMMGPWRSALVVEWAAYDAVAVFGLVLGFLRHEPETFAPFGVISFLSLLMTRPRVDDLLALARRTP